MRRSHKRDEQGQYKGARGEGVPQDPCVFRNHPFFSAYQGLQLASFLSDKMYERIYCEQRCVLEREMSMSRQYTGDRYFLGWEAEGKRTIHFRHVGSRGPLKSLFFLEY